MRLHMLLLSKSHLLKISHSYRSVARRIKTLSADCTDMTGLLRTTVRLETNISADISFKKPNTVVLLLLLPLMAVTVIELLRVKRHMLVYVVLLMFFVPIQRAIGPKIITHINVLLHAQFQNVPPRISPILQFFCFLLHNKELSDPYFQAFEVCPPIASLHPTRRRSPPPTNRDLEKP